MFCKSLRWQNHCNCTIRKNLYEMNFTKVHWAYSANLVQSPTEDGALEVWQCHLGHLNVKSVHTLQSMESSMYLGKFSYPHIIVALRSMHLKKKKKKTKHKGVFPNKGEGSTKPLEILCSDVWDPMRTTSIDSAKFFMAFIDNFSRFGCML